MVCCSGPFQNKDINVLHAKRVQRGGGRVAHCIWAGVVHQQREKDRGAWQRSKDRRCCGELLRVRAVHAEVGPATGYPVAAWLVLQIHDTGH